MKECDKQERATLFMTLLTVFKVLPIRYCGQEDFVGTPVANRGFAETQSLIGCFVNTVVVRTKLEGDQTFRGALGRVE